MKKTSRILIGSAMLFSTAAFLGACKSNANNADTTSAGGSLGASTGAMAPAPAPAPAPATGASTGAMPGMGASTGAAGASTGAAMPDTAKKKTTHKTRKH